MNALELMKDKANRLEWSEDTYAITFKGRDWELCLIEVSKLIERIAELEEELKVAYAMSK